MHGKITQSPEKPAPYIGQDYDSSLGEGSSHGTVPILPSKGKEKLVNSKPIRELSTHLVIRSLEAHYRANSTIERFMLQEQPDTNHSFVRLKIIEESQARDIESQIDILQNQNQEFIQDDQKDRFIDIYKVFDHKPNVKKVFIFGASGVGKSTLCQNIAVTMSREDLFTIQPDENAKEETLNETETRFQTSIWLPLSLLKTSNLTNSKDPIDNLAILIADNCGSDKGYLMPELAEIKSYLNGNWSNILFILDGYDELHQTPDGQSPLEKVLGLILGNSTTHAILTSRPQAITLENKSLIPDLKLENIGFAQEEIIDFVNKYPFRPNEKSQAKASELIGIISSNANLSALSRIPFNLELICTLFASSRLATDATITGLYSEMVDKHLSRRDKKRPQKHKYSKSSNGESSSTQTTHYQLINYNDAIISTLAQIALWGMENNQQRKISIKSIFHIIQEQAVTFELEETQLLNEVVNVGIIKVINTNQDIKDNEIYFNHQTFEEYFCAKALTMAFLGEGKDLKHAIKLLQKHKYNPSYERVWVNLVGFLHNEYINPHNQQKPLYELALMKFFDTFEDEPRELVGLRHNMLALKLLAECQVDENNMTKLISSRLINHSIAIKSLFDIIASSQKSIIKIHSINALIKIGNKGQEVIAKLEHVLKNDKVEGVKLYAAFALIILVNDNNEIKKIVELDQLLTMFFKKTEVNTVNNNTLKVKIILAELLIRIDSLIKKEVSKFIEEYLLKELDLLKELEIKDFMIESLMRNNNDLQIKQLIRSHNIIYTSKVRDLVEILSRSDFITSIDEKGFGLLPAGVAGVTGVAGTAGVGIAALTKVLAIKAFQAASQAAIKTSEEASKALSQAVQSSSRHFSAQQALHTSEGFQAVKASNAVLDAARNAYLSSSITLQELEALQETEMIQLSKLSEALSGLSNEYLQALKESEVLNDAHQAIKALKEIKVFEASEASEVLKVAASRVPLAIPVGGLILLMSSAVGWWCYKQWSANISLSNLNRIVEQNPKDVLDNVIKEVNGRKAIVLQWSQEGVLDLALAIRLYSFSSSTVGANQAIWLEPMKDISFIYKNPNLLLSIEFIKDDQNKSQHVIVDLNTPQNHRQLTTTFDQTIAVLQAIKRAFENAKLPNPAISQYLNGTFLNSSGDGNTPREITYFIQRCMHDSSIVYYQLKEAHNLRNAAEKGDIDKVREILEDKNINIDDKDPETGNTALILALDNEHWDTAKLILDAGSNIYFLNKNFYPITPFFLAMSILLNKDNKLECFNDLAKRSFLDENKHQLSLINAIRGYKFAHGDIKENIINQLAIAITGESMSWRQNINNSRLYKHYLENMKDSNIEKKGSFVSKASNVRDVLLWRLHTYLELFVKYTAKDFNYSIDLNINNVQKILIKLYIEIQIIIVTYINTLTNSKQEGYLECKNAHIIEKFKKLNNQQEIVFETGYNEKVGKETFGHSIYTGFYKFSNNQILVRVYNRGLKTGVVINETLIGQYPWIIKDEDDNEQVRAYFLGIFDLTNEKNVKALNKHLKNLLIPRKPSIEIIDYVYGKDLPNNVAIPYEDLSLEMQDYIKIWPTYPIQEKGTFNCTLSSYNIGILTRRKEKFFNWLIKQEIAALLPFTSTSYKPNNTKLLDNINNSNELRGAPSEELPLSLRELIRKFSVEANINPDKINKGIWLEQNLVAMAGISTSQENTSFWIHNDRDIIFRLNFANDLEIDQFIDYYNQKFSKIITEPYIKRNDGLVEIIMNGYKLYNKVSCSLAGYISTNSVEHKDTRGCYVS